MLLMGRRGGDLVYEGNGTPCNQIRNGAAEIWGPIMRATKGARGCTHGKCNLLEVRGSSIGSKKNREGGGKYNRASTPILCRVLGQAIGRAHMSRVAHSGSGWPRIRKGQEKKMPVMKPLLPVHRPVNQ